MITDAAGAILARRGLDDGAGVVTAEIVLPVKPAPTEAIPERFWNPERMPSEWKEAWERWFPRGEDYYKTVTLAYLSTGELDEVRARVSQGVTVGSISRALAGASSWPSRSAGRRFLAPWS